MTLASWVTIRARIEICWAGGSLFAGVAGMEVVGRAEMVALLVPAAEELVVVAGVVVEGPGSPLLWGL